MLMMMFVVVVVVIIIIIINDNMTWWLAKSKMKDNEWLTKWNERKKWQNEHYSLCRRHDFIDHKNFLYQRGLWPKPSPDMRQKNLPNRTRKFCWLVASQYIYNAVYNGPGYHNSTDCFLSKIGNVRWEQSHTTYHSITGFVSYVLFAANVLPSWPF